MPTLVFGISLAQASNAATVVAAIVAGVGIIYGAAQLRISRGIAQCEFLLRLDEAMRQHATVHSRLIDGAWATGNPEPTSADLDRVTAYIGLFERIKVLIDQGMIDLETFDLLYGYRIDLIADNGQILNKLEGNPAGWRHFFDLRTAQAELHAKGMGRARRIRLQPQAASQPVERQ